MVVDRRLPTARRGTSGTWVSTEPPVEHMRNAMQLLVVAIEGGATLHPAEFTRLAESALARLSLALAAMEENRR